MSARCPNLLDRPLPPKQRAEYTEACIARGSAPVKAQFVVDPISFPPLRAALQSLAEAAAKACADAIEETAGTTRPNTADSDADVKATPKVKVSQRSSDVKETSSEEIQTTHQESKSADTTTEGQRKRRLTETSTSPEPPKKLRGQNKNRKENAAQVTRTRESQLCPKFAASGSCPYGDECTYSHNAEEWENTRPPYLGDTCTRFERHGMCPMGLNCRFGKSHVVDGCNVKKDGTAFTAEDFEAFTKMTSISNEFSGDFKIQLRKKQVPLERAAKWTEYWAAEVKRRAKERDSTSLEKCESEWLGPLVSCEGEHRELRAKRSQKADSLFRGGKSVLAPLTTVGNLPFRRLCISYGADVTVSEMSLCTSLLEGRQSELALIKRHADEKNFGIQIVGGWVESMASCAEFVKEYVDCDFLDVNMGCPLDAIHKKGGGSVLISRLGQLEGIVRGMSQILEDRPLTVKVRNWHDDKPREIYKALSVVPRLRDWGASAIFHHGRTSKQRYMRTADWDYIRQCRATVPEIPYIGNGDVMSGEEFRQRIEDTKVDAVMIGRGALVRPWIFEEIKRGKLWDISASERLDMYRQFVNFGLDHWGSDTKGIETTRRFFLEWMGFACRYIPIDLLERAPQKVNWRPPRFVGRNDTETLLGSAKVSDWIKISEMFLGPVPEPFVFVPKHKSSQADWTQQGECGGTVNSW